MNPAPEEPHQTRDGFRQYDQMSQGILPSPAILESYEEISPGFVKKMSEIIDKEQKHRHDNERKQYALLRLVIHISVVVAIAVVIGNLMLLHAGGTDAIPQAVSLNICAFLFLLITNIRIHKSYQKMQDYIGPKIAKPKTHGKHSQPPSKPTSTGSEVRSSRKRRYYHHYRGKKS